MKPPYGVVAAINLDKGDMIWRVAHGDTPDNVRNHPALQGLDIPKTGLNSKSSAALLGFTIASHTVARATLSAAAASKAEAE